MNGPILFLRVRILPRDFSMMDGKASLNVWPVGAVSNTTTLKSIELTNLSRKHNFIDSYLIQVASYNKEQQT